MQQHGNSSTPGGIEIGRRLAQCRSRVGVSPEWIWRGLGVSPRLLELYETGAYPVLPAHLDAFAAAFGVPRSALAAIAEPLTENRA